MFDLHAHGIDVAPRPVRRAFDMAPSMDPAFSFDQMKTSGIDAMVACVLGDPLGTLWRAPRDPWKAVRRQFVSLENQADAAGVAVIRNSTELNTARAQKVPSIVLAMEGADILGPDLHRLEWLHERGVRMIGLVHYSDNALGTIGTTVCGQPRSRKVRRGARTAGLTRFGAEAISLMNDLGIIVDVAHADSATTLSACAASDAPVVSSHTGAASLDDLSRYISDEEIVAIAATGGLIGLWPFRLRKRGMSDSRDFARHAAHVADLVGIEHLAFGTDANGGPATMAKYNGPQDNSEFITGLSAAGFSEDDCAAIMGGNALRVFTAVCG
ncbi:membrane dipeptidase [Rhodococcus erythropolis]|nr:membrane dipeptidase [Rhodococcus qingshengii]MCZ4527405.1 membrane dipeptidase [Rhodococcus erythropolis]